MMLCPRGSASFSQSARAPAASTLPPGSRRQKILSSRPVYMPITAHIWWSWGEIVIRGPHTTLRIVRSPGCYIFCIPERCGSPYPLRTALGSETARATTSRTDLYVASSTREARQSAINWSRSNIVLTRQCVWTAEFVRGAHCHVSLRAVHPSFSSPSRRAVMRACPFRIVRSQHYYGEAPHTLGPLRWRRERPRGRAAEQRHERAPPHSITSSARASSAGGTVRPSALAVLRLIASSNFVGCSTGSSAGLAPLKILSTKAAARSKLCALRDRNPAAQWSPALAIDMWEHHQPRVE